MKTPRSDQEDLIRLTLQEEERFVYNETNTGHEGAAESKRPDTPAKQIRIPCSAINVCELGNVFALLGEMK